MQKSLNTSLIKKRLEEYGYNQTSISEQLKVSREAVSQWLKSKTLPKPAKLLKLGKLLDLSYSELVIQKNILEPRVAFRKKGAAKTTMLHIIRAKEMGFALERLVEFLPAQMMIKPPELKEPINNYVYVQKAASTIREKFAFSNSKIAFVEIINVLNSFNSILIPVLLGSKKNHENALHIYLPGSKTTWIYINLDTKVFDFKFWLAHELGHVLTPALEGNEAEDFADNFAGAFLFPVELAENKYLELIKTKSKRRQINCLIKTAEQLVVSPITIYKEVNKYAKHNKLDKIDLEKDLYASTTSFTNEFQLVSHTLFKTTKPEVEKYIQISEKEFSTIFFILLKKYHLENELKPGFVSSVLNVPYMDAREISEYMVNGTD